MGKYGVDPFLKNLLLQESFINEFFKNMLCILEELEKILETNNSDYVITVK